MGEGKEPGFADRLASLSPEEREAFLEQFNAADVKETVYMIESPSPDDLYKERNEGDALAKTLSLAEVKVVYYLAVTEDTFQSAFDDIAIRINADNNPTEMPFIHISAHGYEHGVELTDGGTIYWDQLTQKLKKLSELIGEIEENLPGIGGLPRINLSLSSCSAFKNYKCFLAGKLPVQVMVGPVDEVGWCQSLIGFTTFYYQAFVLRQTFFAAVRAMNNAAAVNTEIFQIDTKVDLPSLAKNGFDYILNFVRRNVADK